MNPLYGEIVLGDVFAVEDGSMWIVVGVEALGEHVFVTWTWLDDPTFELMHDFRRCDDRVEERAGL